MKTLLSGKEVIGYFPKLTVSKLRRCRKEGLKCVMIDGAYYYNYDDVVRFFING